MPPPTTKLGLNVKFHTLKNHIKNSQSKSMTSDKSSQFKRNTYIRVNVCAYFDI